MYPTQHNKEKKVWYIWCILRTTVNATMYSYPAQ
jgi:hypothetical protein